MVGVQVGVDNVVQWVTTERLIDQGQCLGHMVAVAGVHHGMGITLREDHVVGGEPAALQHGHARGRLTTAAPPQAGTGSTRWAFCHKETACATQD